MGHCRKDSKTMKNLQMIFVKLSILDYAQIAFVSAKERQRLRTLFPYINEASENHKNVFKALH